MIRTKSKKGVAIIQNPHNGEILAMASLPTYDPGEKVAKQEYLNNNASKDYRINAINKYPICLLYLEVDPTLVDVNIHPRKTEVKLSIEDKLCSILPNLIPSILLT